MKEFDIRDFGAVGDGVTVNTAAIQSAIDACAEAGGECLAEILQGIFYLMKPLIISSSACFSVRPGVIGFFR